MTPRARGTGYRVGYARAIVSSIDFLLASAAPFPDLERACALARSPHSTDRSRFQPGHFTASGFVASPDGSSLLLIHHRRLNRWLQPGGHIDPEDAAPINAAMREVLEETGVRTVPITSDLIDLDIHQIPARVPEPMHEHFDLRFALRAVGTALAANDEVRDVAWSPWEQLGSFGVDESVLRGAEALRRACQ